jgi:hypothetical protein
MSDQWDPSGDDWNEDSDPYDSDPYDSDSYDDEDFDDQVTAICPECGGEVHEESVRCPLCGDYIDWSRANRRPSTWITVCRLTAVILVLALIFPFLVNLYQLLTVPRP